MRRKRGEMEGRIRRNVKLEAGKVYRNRGGGEFRCVTPQHLPYDRGEERLENVKTGWTFRAHGVTKYPDGIIEWDYSTGGYFREKEN